MQRILSAILMISTYSPGADTSVAMQTQVTAATSVTHTVSPMMQDHIEALEQKMSDNPALKYIVTNYFKNDLYTQRLLSRANAITIKPVALLFFFPFYTFTTVNKSVCLRVLLLNGELISPKLYIIEHMNRAFKSEYLEQGISLLSTITAKYNLMTTAMNIPLDCPFILAFLDLMQQPEFITLFTHIEQDSQSAITGTLQAKYKLHLEQLNYNGINYKNIPAMINGKDVHEYVCITSISDTIEAVREYIKKMYLEDLCAEFDNEEETQRQIKQFFKPDYISCFARQQRDDEQFSRYNHLSPEARAKLLKDHYTKEDHTHLNEEAQALARRYTVRHLINA